MLPILSTLYPDERCPYVAQWTWTVCLNRTDVTGLQQTYEAYVKQEGRGGPGGGGLLFNRAGEQIMVMDWKKAEVL